MSKDSATIEATSIRKDIVCKCRIESSRNTAPPPVEEFPEVMLLKNEQFCTVIIELTPYIAPPLTAMPLFKVNLEIVMFELLI